MSEIAVLIPTINRSARIKRQLDFYLTKETNNFAFYIYDSSVGEDLENNITYINSISLRMKIHHVIGINNVGVGLSILSKKVKEDYVIANNDDDLLILENVLMLKSLLSTKGPEYVAILGKTVRCFTLTKEGQTIIDREIVFGGIREATGTPKENLFNNVNMESWMGVFKIAAARTHWQEAAKLSRMHTMNITIFNLPLILGKIAFEDKLIRVFESYRKNAYPHPLETFLTKAGLEDLVIISETFEKYIDKKDVDLFIRKLLTQTIIKDYYSTIPKRISLYDKFVFLVKTLLRSNTHTKILYNGLVRSIKKTAPIELSEDDKTHLQAAKEIIVNTKTKGDLKLSHFQERS
jgi:hypothetical protein